jgi:hypothetical protein
MALPRAQRLLLLAAKLGAIVNEQWPVAQQESADRVPVPFAGGAAIVGNESIWALIDETIVDRDPMDQQSSADSEPVLPRGWLGGSILLAARRGLSDLHVMAEHFTPDHARLASHFSVSPKLWNVVGRSISAVPMHAYQSVEYPTAIVELFREVIENAGADAVVEHGVLRAEVLGLEVGRVELDDDGVPQLAVGVGRHDRLAQAMMYGTSEVVRSLQEAVDSVKSHRRANEGIHPANQLSPERWMRALLPALLNLTATHVESTVEPRLKVPSPAMAMHNDVLFACSCGVDLDAVAAAADTAAFYQASRIVFVTPVGDDIAAIRELASASHVPVEVVTVPRNWRDL